MENENNNDIDQRLHEIEKREKQIDLSINSNINEVKILDNIQMELEKLNKKMEYFLDTYSKAMEGPTVRVNKEELYTTSSIVNKRYKEKISDQMDWSLRNIKDLRSQKESLSKEKESLLEEDKD